MRSYYYYYACISSCGTLRAPMPTINAAPRAGSSAQQPSAGSAAGHACAAAPLLPPAQRRCQAEIQRAAGCTSSCTHAQPLPTHKRRKQRTQSPADALSTLAPRAYDSLQPVRSLPGACVPHCKVRKRLKRKQRIEPLPTLFNTFTFCPADCSQEFVAAGAARAACLGHSWLPKHGSRRNTCNISRHAASVARYALRRGTTNGIVACFYYL
jgi:hypothetical protein